MIYSQASVNRHIDHDVRGIRSRWYSRSKLVSRDLYSPTKQSVPPNNALKFQINFFFECQTAPRSQWHFDKTRSILQLL